MTPKESAKKITTQRVIAQCFAKKHLALHAMSKDKESAKKITTQRAIAQYFVKKRLVLHATSKDKESAKKITTQRAIAQYFVKKHQALHAAKKERGFAKKITTPRANVRSTAKKPRAILVTVTENGTAKNPTTQVKNAAYTVNQKMTSTPVMSWEKEFVMRGGKVRTVRNALLITLLKIVQLSANQTKITPVPRLVKRSVSTCLRSPKKIVRGNTGRRWLEL